MKLCHHECYEWWIKLFCSKFVQLTWTRTVSQLSSLYGDAFWTEFGTILILLAIEAVLPQLVNLSCSFERHRTKTSMCAQSDCGKCVTLWNAPFYFHDHDIIWRRIREIINASGQLNFCALISLPSQTGIIGVSGKFSFICWYRSCLCRHLVTLAWRRYFEGTSVLMIFVS